MVSSTPWPHFTPRKDPVPILQEAGWASGPVWTGGKSRPHWDSIPHRPARSQSLYRLIYPAHHPPSSAEVKERVELYIYTPLWAVMACSRVKFTFLLYMKFRLYMVSFLRRKKKYWSCQKFTCIAASMCDCDLKHLCILSYKPKYCDSRWSNVQLQ